VAFPASEVATLRVNGVDYTDFESVQVKHQMQVSPFFSFRFTASEFATMPSSWTGFQILPGDWCEIFLAGELAFGGYVTTRRAYYDSTRHYIEILGSSATIVLASTGFVMKGTNELQRATLQKIIQTGLGIANQNSDHAIGLKVKGGSLPSQIFERVAPAPGSSILSVFDKYARAATGSSPFTSDQQGNFVVVMGPSGPNDTVVENDAIRGGVKIIEAQEYIYNNAFALQGSLNTVGQMSGNNVKWGPDITHIPHFSDLASLLGSGKNPQLSIMETVPWVATFLKSRTGGTRGWHEADQITVWATVHGWLKPSGGLWTVGQPVQVVSPMLVMDGSEGLFLWSATFVQDNQIGTRTILECRNRLAFSQGVPQA